MRLDSGHTGWAAALARRTVSHTYLQIGKTNVDKVGQPPNFAEVPAGGVFDTWVVLKVHPKVLKAPLYAPRTTKYITNY